MEALGTVARLVKEYTQGLVGSPALLVYEQQTARRASAPYTPAPERRPPQKHVAGARAARATRTWVLHRSHIIVS
jgi:hypothetical protein